MKDIAIKVENVSKIFRIPHEKHTSLKEATLNLFSRRTFEVFEALKNVSFEVRKGEFFGMIGRNGSGKSTLLKILAGIYIPNKGRTIIKGKVSPFLELGVGFNPELTGRENIFLGGSILGLSDKEVKEKYNQIVEFSELQDFIDLKLKNYSSGMQVRLAFALAINVYADILLMDEVLAVGDTNFQIKCIREFNKYKDQGKTVILVTHDVQTVQRYCDRVMLLRNGKIVKIDKPEEVINKYTFQNISDEETQDDKKDTEIKKSLKSPVEITKVEILDNNGKTRSSFQTGESLSILIEFKNKNRTEINVGIGLHSTFGETIFGYNTQIDNFNISKDSTKVILKINKTPLLKGEYFINITFFGEIVEDIYEFMPKCKTIRIFSTGRERSYGGLFSIDHEWQ